MNPLFKNFLSSKKSGYLIILFLLFFSAILRFGFLNAGLFHHDSVQLAVAVEKTVSEPGLYGIGGGRHGLVIINSIFFHSFKLFFWPRICRIYCQFHICLIRDFVHFNYLSFFKRTDK